MSSKNNNLQDVIVGRETVLEVGGIENLHDNFTKVANHIQNCRKNKQTTPTKFFALGGIGEVGKNTYCIEHDDEIIIIDAGIKFANRKLYPGLTGTVAGISYLKQNENKIKGLYITHGHEDHIGGIVYMLKQIKISAIYSPVIASELIKRKLGEHKLSDQKVILYTGHSAFFTKYFVIDFFKVNHSIPDAFGLSISTPNGIIVSSGDFRFDFASKGDKFDLQKIQEISARKIDLLLCESTNAEQPGFNESEKVVISEINNIISSSTGRVIITFFASNLGRVEEIIKIAINCNRKICVFGRSIDASIAASQKVGYIKINKKLFISSNEITNYQDHEILIICTGSQGEENAVLNTISKNKHPWIKLKTNDNIIFSSNVIPGNTSGVDELINRLYKSGCNIFLHSSSLKIHSSGHASKLEQQLFVSLVNPKYLIPIHGETRMLKELKRNCVELGFPKNNIFIFENGSVAHLLNGVVTHSNEFLNTDPLFVVGNETTANGLQILKDRENFGKEGILLIHAVVDLLKKEVIVVSPVTSIASFYLSESFTLLKKINFSIKQKLKELIKVDGITVRKITEACTLLLEEEVFLNKRQRPIVKFFVTNTNRDDFWKNSIQAAEKKEESVKVEEKKQD